MKKKIAILLICSLGIMAALSGCSSDDTGTSSSSADGEAGLSADAETDETITADTLLQATDYDVTEYVTLMDDYMNLSVELTDSYEVTDDVVQEYIESYILAYYPMTTVLDKTTVEDGDMVNIDYVGTLDGEEFDGGSDEDYNLTIGSDTFIDGFEDGLIGAEVGDTLDLNLTFPDEYSSEDLAGQDVVFTVTVNSIVEEEVLAYDEMTDEYVVSVLGDYYSTVDEMVEDVRAYMESSYESEKQSAIQSSVLEQLLAGCTVTLPDGMLDEKVTETVAQLEESAESYGMEYADFIYYYYSYDDEDEFLSYLTETLQESMEEELILEAIVADQQISITRSDFDSFVDSYVSYYSYDSAEAFYEAFGGEDYIMLNYAENLALSSMVDAATTTVAESSDEAVTE